MQSSIATGSVTPRTGSSPRPFILSYPPHYEHTFLIPTSIYLSTTSLRDSFLSTLPPPTENALEFESTMELIARFMGFLAEKVEAEGEAEDVLAVVCTEFEQAFLGGNEVHGAVATLECDIDKKKAIVKAYYHSRHLLSRPLKSHDSALLRAIVSASTSPTTTPHDPFATLASHPPAKMFAIFGGQGYEDYFDELTSLYSTYGVLVGEFVQACAKHLANLAREEEQSGRGRKVFGKGLNVMGWILGGPDSRPDQEYLSSAPVSFPCVGLTQLVTYYLTCRILSRPPSSFREYISGATGHSQGIIPAWVIASSTTWEDFEERSIKALTILFFIGLRAQQAFPVTTLPPQVLEDALGEGEGMPSPMLSIRDLGRNIVEKYVEQVAFIRTNKHLPENKRVQICLVNGPRVLVVVGPPGSLNGLNLALRKLKAPPGLEQGRVPHSERKLRFTNRFLSVSSPFHSSYLGSTAPIILADLEKHDITSSTFPASDLFFPLYATDTGLDMRTESNDIIGDLVRMITERPLFWEKATEFPGGATHIVDFGPGRSSGLGALTGKNKDGTGVRIIVAGAMPGEGGVGGVSGMGAKDELFDRGEGSVKWNVDWVREHRPQLVKTKAGRIFVSTAFSRLIGKPPLMVAGMTPATVPASFVAAIMNAGYHVELAGGGYYSPKRLTEAIKWVEGQIVPGHGITLNSIYINPRAYQWQMDLVQQLRAEGVPIEGVCVGAGIPSLEVANELIESLQNLGLKHFGLKPGSAEGIAQVVAIAQANPTFPIICQWTGGRAGGHHSYEDFHTPMLQMYSTVRRHSNIILVAGSGFGGSDDTEPYLTGEWALKFAYPPMPFDGIMFGSRMMTAKEAKTSPGAKQAIVDAPGVSEEHWEKTYKGPVGGVITVRSELGEPIHKLATRGVLFWKNLDDTIFNLPKEKRAAALKKRKNEIVQKLNDDFQKVWFGVDDRDKGIDSSGNVVNLEEMTYERVVKRMVELMFVKHESRWIDITLRNLVGDFIRRVEERFTREEGKPSLLQNFADLDIPFETVDKIMSSYPESQKQLMNAQDVEHFLVLCQRRGQKPVPFIPILDQNFEWWFKKDSLWQSEDLEAVVGQDVGRTCILQGPMAAQHSKVVDEPVKDILDGIHEGHVAALKKRYYGDDDSRIPVVEYFGGAPVLKNVEREVEQLEGVTLVDESKDKKVYRLTGQVTGISLPDREKWIQMLGGEKYSWRKALFTTDVLVQGTKFLSNPIKGLFAPRYDQQVQIEYPSEVEKTVITVYEKRSGEFIPAVKTRRLDETTIEVLIFENRTASGDMISLQLLYTYHPSFGFAPIREVMDGRNDRIKKFYWQLWFGSDPWDTEAKVTDTFISENIKVDGNAIEEFCHSVGNRSEAYVQKPGEESLAPMDFAIVIGWKSIMKAVFPKSIEGDLLKLVHLSNGFRMMPGARPLKTGDEVETIGEVNAVINNDSGKLVEVKGRLFRDGKPLMEVTSQFLYRGVFEDYENTFQKSVEIPMQVNLASTKDVAVLKSKEWFHILDPQRELLNTALTFRLSSLVRFKNKTVFSSVQTSGSVWMELDTKEVIQVAAVEYEAGESHGNPVMSYLQRHGTPIEQPVPFENGGYSVMPDPSILTGDIVSPSTNSPYASISGDFNPIHVNQYFASYASLPGTITHGMWSSAATRKFVETFAAENKTGRVTYFNVKFIDMVLPNARLQTKLAHTGMVNGKKIIKVETFNQDTGNKVLEGTAEIDQPVTAYVFTGQGSQEQGMGMDLYASSPVARAIWDKADEHFLSNYGFSIIDIVRNNPAELTVYFGGPKGKAIRQNYLNMVYEMVDSNGVSKTIPIFKGIDENSTFYKFVSPTGLLSATQFTQPALTLMEKAALEDMRSKGLVQRDCVFAGHSLGEYSALAAISDVLPIQSLVDITFYRGLTMQVAVQRDALGRSEYGMVAANPSRVSPTFNETALRYVVDMVAQQTGWLLEIVNFNVENSQYVCAGHLNALDCLSNVLNFLKTQKIDMQKLLATLSLEEVKQRLSEIVEGCAERSRKKAEGGPIDLERGIATIPLKSIDVPFHSSFLRNGVRPFRGYLTKKILRSQVNPSLLIGKYIPNLTAKPFSISKDYIEEVHKLTGSPKLAAVLNNWSKYQYIEQKV